MRPSGVAISASRIKLRSAPDSTTVAAPAMPAPPETSLRACAACGTPVDPLRAPVVAILDGRFAYFCSTTCKQAASAQSIVPPAVVPRIVEVEVPALVVEPRTAIPIEDEAPPAYAKLPEPLEEPEAEPLEDERPDEAPLVQSTEERAPRNNDGAARGLRALALVIAFAAVSLALVDAKATTVRLELATASCLLLMGLLLSTLRLARRGSLEAAIEVDLGGAIASGVVAATASVVLAWTLLVLHKPGAATAISAAVWVVLAAAAAESVAHAVMRNTLADARAILGALDGAGSGAEGQIGELLQIAVGDHVRSDLRVVSGDVVIEQWGLPSLRVRRGPGGAVPGGAVVREGSARVRITATGATRAFARLLVDALSRSDRASPGLRSLDGSAPWLIGAVVVVAIAIGVLSKGRIGPTLVAGIAAGASILATPARRLAVREQLRGIVEACRHGAAFRDADAFARAGSVRTAIFCSRGTLLAANPEACEVEELGALASPTDVLALAAGAERSIEHPIARALIRTATARAVRPIDVRNVAWEPGLGVRGELASGQSVVIGGRELCLREHVPTAEHETRIEELERTGREVLLVARGGRLIGLVAMQYPLRAGALAAVQRVEDVEVEPVLLGGGARARLEAIGKAIGVEHVRPEILPDDRAAEVKRIAQSSGPVAVFGRLPNDAAALGAATVAVALEDAGVASDGREEGRALSSVALVHDRLVPAVDVLALAQATRARVGATLVVGLAPVALAALPVAFGLVRPSWAPLAALAATVALGVRELVAAALPEGGHFDDTR